MQNPLRGFRITGRGPARVTLRPLRGLRITRAIRHAATAGAGTRLRVTAYSPRPVMRNMALKFVENNKYVVPT